ncbi:MAG: hypothetical protein WCL00_13675 [Bacteroidota bacterium]
MSNQIARIVNILFHPFLLPFYLFVILLNYHLGDPRAFLMKGKLIIEGMVLLTTAVLPYVTNYFLFTRKLISSMSIEKRTERIYPLLNASIFYYLTYYLLKGIEIPPIYSYVMLAWTLVVICTVVINLFHKISIYMVNMGSITGILLGLTLGHGFALSYISIFFILMTGITGWARLFKETHKPSEIYTGVLLGFTVMFGLLYFL